MKAKKKYKCFNYNMSIDCKELFTEFEDNYKNETSKSEKKKGSYMNKKEKNTKNT